MGHSAYKFHGFTQEDYHVLVRDLSGRRHEIEAHGDMQYGQHPNQGETCDQRHRDDFSKKRTVALCNPFFADVTRIEFRYSPPALQFPL